MENKNFKVGDKVMYTNEYGATFGSYEITKIVEDSGLPERTIYLNKESHWFPVRPSELSKVNYDD